MMFKHWLRKSSRGLERRLFPRRVKDREFRIVRRYHLSDLRIAKPVEPELVLLPVLLSGKHQPVCIDVGANRGHYLYAMEQLTASENILAIEPEPTNAAHLRQYFPNVVLLGLALSDQEGTAEIKVPIMGEQVYTSRATLERFVDVGETDARHIQVQLSTLDRVVVDRGWTRVDFIKIDVEGHEGHVVRGGLHVLESLRPRLLIEIEQRHHSEPILHVFEDLQERGYLGWFVDTRAGELRPLVDFTVEQYQDLEHLTTADYVNNFFFLPAEEASLIPELQHAVRQAASA